MQPGHYILCTCYRSCIKVRRQANLLQSNSNKWENSWIHLLCYQATSAAGYLISNLSFSQKTWPKSRHSNYCHSILYFFSLTFRKQLNSTKLGKIQSSKRTKAECRVCSVTKTFISWCLEKRNQQSSRKKTLNKLSMTPKNGLEMKQNSW